MTKPVVIIPCRNESGSIGVLVKEVLARGNDCIVVDDGSDDFTGPMALAAGAEVIRHQRNRGIAAAIQSGWAGVGDAEYVVVMDAGGSHDPRSIKRIVGELQNGADLVVGSRFCKMGVYKGRPSRKFLSKCYVKLMNFAQGKARHSDWTSGYRGYSARAVRELRKRHYVAMGHAWQAEVLAYAGEMGLCIREVPIVYKAGESSLRWRGVVEAIGMWLHVLHHVGKVQRV